MCCDVVCSDQGSDSISPPDFVSLEGVEFSLRETSREAELGFGLDWPMGPLFRPWALAGVLAGIFDDAAIEILPESFPGSLCLCGIVLWSPSFSETWSRLPADSAPRTSA